MPVIALDNLLDDGKVAPIRYIPIKLDVEGVEIEAMKGGVRLLRGDSVYLCEEHGNDPRHTVSRYILEQTPLKLIVYDPRTNRLETVTALRLFDEAWAIPDYESRLELLRTIWADDGLYVDPDVPEGVRGPEALASTIDAQFELTRGCRSSAARLMSLATAPGSAGARHSGRGSHSMGSTSSSSRPTGESPG